VNPRSLGSLGFGRLCRRHRSRSAVPAGTAPRSLRAWVWAHATHRRQRPDRSRLPAGQPIWTTSRTPSNHTVAVILYRQAVTMQECHGVKRPKPRSMAGKPHNNPLSDEIVPLIQPDAVPFESRWGILFKYVFQCSYHPCRRLTKWNRISVNDDTRMREIPAEGCAKILLIVCDENMSLRTAVGKKTVVVCRFPEHLVRSHYVVTTRFEGRYEHARDVFVGTERRHSAGLCGGNASSARVAFVSSRSRRSCRISSGLV